MEDLETHRKRLLYQSQHRGMREMDLLFKAFAERVQSMTQEELEDFEFLLSFPDQTLYSLFFDEGPLPEGVSKPLVKEWIDLKMVR